MTINTMTQIWDKTAKATQDQWTSKVKVKLRRDQKWK